MAKGYWIATVDVSDPSVDGYGAYVRANAAAFSKYGARFLVRGGATTTMEGQVRSRVVVIEFADYETALACYRSAEYTAAIALRKDVAVADLVIAEGYDGAQPGG